MIYIKKFSPTPPRGHTWVQRESLKAMSLMSGGLSLDPGTASGKCCLHVQRGTAALEIGREAGICESPPPGRTVFRMGRCGGLVSIYGLGVSRALSMSTARSRSGKPFLRVPILGVGWNSPLNQSVIEPLAAVSFARAARKKRQRRLGGAPGYAVAPTLPAFGGRLRSRG